MSSQQKVAKIRLLYVDDEVDILKVVKRGLEYEGDFAVDVTDSAKNLIGLSTEELSTYNLIILDIRMPKLDGFELYDILRDRIDPSRTKICFFTAYHSYQNEYRKLFSGWNDDCFIAKPISIKAFAEIIRRLVSA